MTEKQRCKERVFRNFKDHQCQRYAVRDGYCKQHHPESVKKRQEESARRYEEQRKRSIWHRYDQLEKHRDRLLEALTNLIPLAEPYFSDEIQLLALAQARAAIANSEGQPPKETT